MYTHVEVAVTAVNATHTLQRKARALTIQNAGDTNEIYVAINRAATTSDWEIAPGQDWPINDCDDVRTLGFICAGAETSTAKIVEQAYDV